MASSSPCGACKFLRRKCATDCVFAPYFCSEEGPARFAAIHKVFGASNASKLLLQLPVPDRGEAVVTIAYEAQARLKDPVYGCVSHIFALQQQVAFLQAQLMQMKIQMAQGIVESSTSAENQWPINDLNYVSPTTMAMHPTNPTNYDLNYVSPQSSICSLGSIDPGSSTSVGANEMRGGGGADDVSSNAYYAKLMDWESYKNCLLDS